VTSLALLNPDQVEIPWFLDRAAPLSPPLRDRYQESWQNLRAENAPLRIIRDDRLRSAPINHFDELVCACTSDQWLPIARVVGHATADSWDDHGIQVDDLVLHSRVRALVASGRLEGRGSLTDWRHGEVRRFTP